MRFLPMAVLHTMTIAAMAGFAAKAADRPSRDREAVESDLLAELAIKHLIGYNRGANAGSLYFVTLGDDGDPTDEFLARFAKFKSTFRKGSRATKTPKDAESSWAVHDTVTGDPGVRLFVKLLRRVSDKEVELSVGQYVGPLNAYRAKYVLKKTRGRWQVVAVKDELMS